MRFGVDGWVGEMRDEAGDGERDRPIKRQILGCLHSFMRRHSRSKYLDTS